MYIYNAENHSADFSSVLQFIELTITLSMLLSGFFLGHGLSQNLHDKVHTRNTPDELVENFNQTWPDFKLGIGRQIGSPEMKQIPQFCVKSRQVHKLRKSHGLGTGNKNLLR